MATVRNTAVAVKIYLAKKATPGLTLRRPGRYFRTVGRLLLKEAPELMYVGHRTGSNVTPILAPPSAQCYSAAARLSGPQRRKSNSLEWAVLHETPRDEGTRYQPNPGNVFTLVTTRLQMRFSVTCSTAGHWAQTGGNQGPCYG